MLTDAIKEMGATYPTIIKTLLDERNLYMVAMLRMLASRCRFLHPGLQQPGPVCD